MKKYKLEDREGWLWPSSDTACWEWLQSEKDIPEVLTTYCTETRVVVQAGGNCGFYVKPYAHLFDTVYTFEPNPQNFYCLCHNVEESNVIKLQACIGNKHQLVGITSKKKNVGVSRVGEFDGGYPTFTIDDLSLTTCDLIHLDIEGYELFALQGAIETIKLCKPIIALEWLGHGTAYGVTQDDLLIFLTELGYKKIGSIYHDFIFSCK